MYIFTIFSRAGHQQVKKWATIDTDIQLPTPDKRHPTTRNQHPTTKKQHQPQRHPTINSQHWTNDIRNTHDKQNYHLTTDKETTTVKWKKIVILTEITKSFWILLYNFREKHHSLDKIMQIFVVCPFFTTKSFIIFFEVFFLRKGHPVNAYLPTYK